MTRVYVLYSKTFHTVLIAYVQDIGYHLSKETNVPMRLMTESAFPISVLVKTCEINRQLNSRKSSQLSENMTGWVAMQSIHCLCRNKE